MKKICRAAAFSLVLVPTWVDAQTVDFAARICDGLSCSISADLTVHICDGFSCSMSADQTWNNVGACSNRPNVTLNICDSISCSISADLTVHICDGFSCSVSADRSFCVTNGNSLDVETLENLGMSN